MSVDLSGMNRSQLETLKKDIETAIKRLAETEKKAAFEAARRAAEEHGFELEELMAERSASKGRSAGAKNPPKYRNPENPSQTWSGRGRRPGWIVEAQEAGRDLSEFAI